MQFVMAPGEILHRGLRVHLGGLLSFLPFVFSATTTIRLTNRRLVVTESYSRGVEVTSYIPLEAIVHVRQGRYTKPRFMYLAILFFVLAVIALPLTLGIGTVIFGIIGGVFLLFYFATRTESLVVDAGAQEPVAMAIASARVEDMQGGRLSREDLELLAEELEAARQALVHGESS